MYDPLWQEVARLIKDMEVYDIVYQAPFIPKSAWYLSQASSGGMAITHLTYVIDPLIKIFGFPAQLDAQGSCEKHKKIEFDRQSINGLFQNKITFHVSVNYLSNAPWLCSINGDKGRLEIRPNPDGGGKLRFLKNGEEKEYDFSNESSTAFVRQLNEFTCAVSKKEQNYKIHRIF